MFGLSYFSVFSIQFVFLVPLDERCGFMAMTVCLSVQHFGPDWNISNTAGWTPGKFYIHVSQRRVFKARCITLHYHRKTAFWPLLHYCVCDVWGCECLPWVKRSGGVPEVQICSADLCGCSQSLRTTAWTECVLTGRADRRMFSGGGISACRCTALLQKTHFKGALRNFFMGL